MTADDRLDSPEFLAKKWIHFNRRSDGKFDLLISEYEDILDAKVAVELERMIARQEAKRIFTLAQQPGTGPPDLDDVPTDATAWLAAAAEEPDWLVEGLVEYGWNVLLAGPAKVGKTTLMLDLLRCLTTDAGKWLRQYPLHFPEGRIGWMNLEMAEPNLRRWAQAAGLDGSRMAEPLNLRGTGFNVFDVDWMDHVRQRIIRDDVRLLVVDSLTELVVGAGLDEHTEILPALAQMDTLREDTPLTNYVYLGHFGHTEERLRGDSRAIGRFDALIKMVSESTGQRFISATGRYDEGDGLSESELVTGPDGYVVEPGVNRKQAAEDVAAQAHEVIKAASASELREVVMAVIADQPGIKSRELREAVNERWAEEHDGEGVRHARLKAAKEHLIDEELVRVEVGDKNAHHHFPEGL